MKTCTYLFIIFVEFESSHDHRYYFCYVKIHACKRNERANKAEIEPPHDKTNKMTCTPSKDSDQSGHLPSLIRVFAVRSVGSSAPKLSSCGQLRLWSDWADAQADLSLRWAHMPLCWFCHKAARMKLVELKFLKDFHWRLLILLSIGFVKYRSKVVSSSFFICFSIISYWRFPEISEHTN